jgi:hypothetical protein
MKNMAKAAALAALFSGVVVADSPGDYASHWPLELSGEGPWYRLEVPMALHLAARYGDLRDLRVFNGAGQALAYALTPGQAQSQALQQHGVKWFPLHAAPGESAAMPNLRVQRSTSGTLIELLDESSEPPATAQLRGWVLDASAIEDELVQLQLNWVGAEDGFQRFSIEASDDLQHWQPWGSGQLARLSFADERIEQRQVALPGREARYLRLLWQSPQQAPQLTEAQLASRTSEQAQAPLVWSEPLTASAAPDGHYQWQFPLALPIERLRLALEQENSLAPLRVSGRADNQGAWRSLASGLLYRLTENGQEMRQDELQLPGWPVRQLRLQLDARGGGLGSEAPSLQMAVRASQLVFLLRGEPPYHLALGRNGAQSAALPLGTLIPGYQPQRLAQLGLASVELQAEALATAQADAAGLDWKRWGLWAVLLAGVGVLALMALSLLRRPQ